MGDAYVELGVVFMWFGLSYTIKAVVHKFNMKFRKLKKNNVRNTNKT